MNQRLNGKAKSRKLLERNRVIKAFMTLDNSFLNGIPKAAASEKISWTSSKLNYFMHQRTPTGE